MVLALFLLLGKCALAMKFCRKKGDTIFGLTRQQYITSGRSPLLLVSIAM